MWRAFRPGEIVRLRDERWRVSQALPCAGVTLLDLVGVDRDNHSRQARFLLPFDRVERVPAGDERPRIVRATEFRRVARQALSVATPSWTALRAAAGANVTLLPFQLEPALALMRGAASRILIADAVGLGKTIQAGLIAAEVLARDRGGRVLIVTPAGLRAQWRDELTVRFALDADVFDATGLARAIVRLPTGVNPWATTRLAITSMDFVKRPDVMRSLEALVWDLVIFDEAHALCGRSDRATAAGLLAARARRVLLLTATPHDGDDDAFARLCRLGRLDVGDDPCVMFRRTREEAGVAGTRRTHVLRVCLSDAEVRMHHELAGYVQRVLRDPLRRGSGQDASAGARLAMIVLQRRACSSAASLARSVERRRAWLAGLEPEPAQLTLSFDRDCSDEDAEPSLELAVPGLADAATERRCLDRILVHAHAAASAERKPALLCRILRRTTEPLIVFTEYRDTLERLAVALSGIAVARLHGGMTTTERAEEARRFTHGSARVLLATDAASEGLNLHRRCRFVVHLEIPWTPLRYEQRVGRVDRLGQSRPVHSIGLVAGGTSEEVIVRRFRSRLARAGQDVATFSGVTRVDLRNEAHAEAARLEQCRRWESGPPPSVTRAHDSGRPIAVVLGRRPRGRVYWAWQIVFLDAQDGWVWETIGAAAATVSGVPQNQDRTTAREWFIRLHGVAGARLTSRADESEAAEAARFAAAIGAPAARLIARERAILDAILRSGARLAQPLLQAGLFDRRAERAALEHERLIRDASARALERVATLERLTGPLRSERRLIFAVAVAR